MTAPPPASTLRPQLLRGGIVTLDPGSNQVQKVIELQYNPDSITRTLTPQTWASDSGDRLDVLRLRGPAAETLRVDVEIDATDDLASPDTAPGGGLASRYGLLPQLAVLETLLSPTVAQLQETHRLADQGILEISPAESPLTLFVWGRRRVMPVIFTDFTVTEDSFDTALNPTRARIALQMRVLTTADLPFTHAGSNVFLSYLSQQTDLADRVPAGALPHLGISSIPGV